MPDRYSGPVAFVDGVHYPVGKDGEPDLKRPLRWTPDGYRAAHKSDSLHNDAHFVRDADIEPGGEG